MYATRVPTDGEAALEAARRASATWDAHATAGKAVLEFAVIKTDKGEAVDILRDQTDVDGGGVPRRRRHRREGVPRMRDGDVGVKVGPGETAAGFRIESPEDVAAALAYLLGGPAHLRC